MKISSFLLSAAIAGCCCLLSNANSLFDDGTEYLVDGPPQQSLLGGIGQQHDQVKTFGGGVGQQSLLGGIGQQNDQVKTLFGGGIGQQSLLGGIGQQHDQVKTFGGGVGQQSLLGGIGQQHDQVKTLFGGIGQQHDQKTLMDQVKTLLGGGVGQQHDQVKTLFGGIGQQHDQKTLNDQVKTLLGGGVAQQSLLGGIGQQHDQVKTLFGGIGQQHDQKTLMDQVKTLLGGGVGQQHDQVKTLFGGIGQQHDQVKTLLGGGVGQQHDQTSDGEWPPIFRQHDQKFQGTLSPLGSEEDHIYIQWGLMDQGPDLQHFSGLSGQNTLGSTGVGSRLLDQSSCEAVSTTAQSLFDNAPTFATEVAAQVARKLAVLGAPGSIRRRFIKPLVELIRKLLTLVDRIVTYRLPNGQEAITVAKEAIFYGLEAVVGKNSAILKAVEKLAEIILRVAKSIYLALMPRLLQALSV